MGCRWSFAIARKNRCAVELTAAAIARIEAIRDLLREVSEASEAESESQPLDRPEEILTDKQKRWLEPPGLVMRLVARILFFANRTVMRTLFWVEARGLDPEERAHNEIGRAHV